MNVNKALYGFIKIAFSILIILVVIYATIHFVKIGYDYGFRLYTETAVDEEPGRDVMVQIKEDMSLNDIAKMMEEKGLVRDSNLFFVQFRLSNYHKQIKPGVYMLNTSMEPKALMKAIAPKEEEPTEAEETDSMENEVTETKEDSETQVQEE